MTALEHLGVRPAGDGGWQARTPEALHGAYGGAFGGLLAAMTVAVARETVPGRRPFALDCHFVRGLRGDASITAEVLRSGRSMSVVSVAMTEDGELTTRATVLLADLAALDDWTVADVGEPPPGTADAKRWRHPPGRHVGIVDTLAPRSKRVDGDAIAATIRIPWPEPETDAAAEASCMAADISTGPPVEAAFTDGWRAHPNPALAAVPAPAHRGRGDHRRRQARRRGGRRRHDVAGGLERRAAHRRRHLDRRRVPARRALTRPSRPGGTT